jgi:hypothetical protein
LCGGPAGATVRHMAEAGVPRRLELEVRFDAEPIEGRLYDREDEQRPVRAFSGWLGLMSAIDAARRADSPLRQQREEEAL